MYTIGFTNWTKQFQVNAKLKHMSQGEVLAKTKEWYRWIRESDSPIRVGIIL